MQSGAKALKHSLQKDLFDPIMDAIEEDDYLFIQFGHNDSTKDRPERYTEAYDDYKHLLATIY